jgi:hypothetical protein
MESTFTISLICPAGNRPPISHKVTDYLVQFIREEILVPRQIILQEEWNVELAMMFMPKDEFGPHKIDIYEPDIYDDVKVKTYPIAIPLDTILQSDEPYRKTIESMYEGLFLYFTAFHKSIHAHFMQDLWEKINFEYLFSLPYPADITEQQYIGD